MATVTRSRKVARPYVAKPVVAKEAGAKQPAKVNDWRNDDSLRFHNVEIVKPAKSFRRKLGAVPSSYEFVRGLWNCTRKKHAEHEVAKYNASAMRHGWTTWAVISVDETAKAFLVACKKAEVKLASDSGRDREGLSIHGSYFGEGTCWFSIDLNCDNETFTHDSNLDIRARAIEKIESTLARIKAESTSGDSGMTKLYRVIIYKGNKAVAQVIDEAIPQDRADELAAIFNSGQRRSPGPDDVVPIAKVEYVCSVVDLRPNAKTESVAEAKPKRAAKGGVS